MLNLATLSIFNPKTHTQTAKILDKAQKREIYKGTLVVINVKTRLKGLKLVSQEEPVYPGNILKECPESKSEE